MPYSLFFFLPLTLFFAYFEISSLAILFGWISAMQVLFFLAPFFRPISWAHAMTFELFSFFSLIVLHFLPSIAKTKGSSTPILLVHGYLNQSNVWWLQKKWLVHFGLGPIYSINLGHPFRSIRDYAAKIDEKAKEIAKETRREDLILIGHSMGGLVSLWYAHKIAPHKVSQIITIATPIFGTPVAKIGLGPNAREMEKKSLFLQELHEAIKSQKIRMQHIATRTDQLVVPGTSALIAENEHRIFDGIGHISLLYSKRVAQQIKKWTPHCQ